MKWRLWFTIITALQVTTIVPVGSAETRSPSGDNLPEVWMFPERLQQSCVVHISLTGGTLSERETKIFRYLSQTYIATQHYRKAHYLPVGVDYLGFREFYLIASQPCSAAGHVSNDVAAALSCGTSACKDSIRFQSDFDRPDWLVDSAPEEKNLSVTKDILKRWSDSRIAKCLLRFTLAKSSDQVAFQAVSGLSLARLEYRLPSAEAVRLVDGHIYILLSRDCSDKGVLVSRLKDIWRLEGLDWNSLLRGPDSDPGAQFYLKLLRGGGDQEQDV